MLERLKGLLLDILQRKGFAPMVVVDDGKIFGVQFIARDVPFAIHIVPTGMDKIPYAVILNSPAVVGIPTDPKVLLAILGMNLTIPIGSFGYTNGTLIYKHSITDNDLTEEELDRIMDIAINVVNIHATRIVSTFGGRLALDFPPGFELRA
ncbi:MAG: hypothetical protein GXO39_04820 [Thermotogae bacterium]|nr:hypothetical protein [Thermotogota bacterium]